MSTFKSGIKASENVIFFTYCFQEKNQTDAVWNLTYYQVYRKLINGITTAVLEIMTG